MTAKVDDVDRKTSAVAVLDAVELVAVDAIRDERGALEREVDLRRQRGDDGVLGSRGAAWRCSEKACDEPWRPAPGARRHAWQDAGISGPRRINPGLQAPHAPELMRNRFDKLAKNLGKEALGRCGPTSAHHEISPETQHADLRHEPDPARKAQRARLGLLGRLASRPCLLEIYSHAPTAEELRAYLAKHLASWQERARAARARRRLRRRSRRRPRAFVAPSLWIIAAGVPRTLLTGLELRSARGWPRGVYFFGGDVLRVGIVVASKLPRNRDTLLVRLMAAGPLLTPAIAELAALPLKAHERAVAEHVLLDLQHVLSRQPSRTPKEKEFIVTMRRSWEDARAEGRLETKAHALLTVLRVRGIPVPIAARKRILAEQDLRRLERWLERASVATSIDEVIDGSARHRLARTARPAAHKERNGRRPLRASAPR